MRPQQENDVFHAIAHPARRDILIALRRGEQPASALAKPFGMSFAAVSQHLKVLGEASTWVDEFRQFFEARLDALGDYLDTKHGRR